jgi:hypothetical protein
VIKARRLAAAQGRPLRIMFADEARFGRMNRPRPCWAPKGVRPEVACQLIREFTYLYGAVCPKDGTCVFLILPAADTECFQIFLNTLAKKYSGPVAGSVGIEGGVVSGVINLESLGVRAPSRRPRHENRYHDA